MHWQGRERSNNIEDRRNSSNNSKSIGIVKLIVILVGAYYGINLTGIIDEPQPLNHTPTQLNPTHQPSIQEQELAQLSAVVLRETEKVWSTYFKKHNAAYPAPKMVLYRNNTPTACGTGRASAGPFYCPADQKLYIDLSFYNTMKNQLGAEGDAAFAYVLAHEVGHHIQTLTGTIDKVHQAQNITNKITADALSVKLELQADCYAGIWGYHAEKDGLFEPGDIQEAYNAAQAVGDDTLSKRAGGYAAPHTYTHGTSAQRKYWFERGFKTGDIQQCNTFAIK